MTKILSSHTIFLGYLYALSATIIWSGNFIISRDLSGSIPPISLAFYRWVVAVMIFLPWALKPLMQQWQALKKNIGYLCISFLLGVTAFNTLIYFAGHSTSAINLSLIAITFPIFIIIISRFFFKELITFKKATGIIIVVIGIILLITKGDLDRLLNLSFAIGDVWMLLASLIFAIYSLLLKQKPKNISIIAFQLSTFILGLIFLLPFFIVESLSVPSFQFNSKIIISIFYLGIFASLFAFLLWNKAITKIGPSKASLIYYTLPLFSSFWAYLFINETISMVHLYSAVLIIAGIFTANYQSKKILKI